MYFIVKDNKVIGRKKTLVGLRGSPEIVEGDDSITLETAAVKEVDGELVIYEESAKKSRKALNKKIRIVFKRMEFGKKLMAMMSVRNNNKDLSDAQKINQMNSFSEINMALINGEVLVARELINLFTPDGTIVKPADKTALLNEISNKELELGY